MNLAALPKIELHVHLEGAVSAATALELARRNGVPLPEDEAAVARLFRCSNRAQFGAAFDFVRTLLRSADDYAFAARRLLADVEPHGVRYVEFRLMPGDLARAGVDVGDALQAIWRALCDGHEATGVIARPILGFSRSRFATDARLTFEAARELRRFGVVGMDVFGDESKRSDAMYSELRRWLDREPVPLCVHAGEWDGPDSVAQALHLLAPARIGHATSAAREPALLDELARSRVHLELNVTSNLATGSIAKVSDHPLPVFHRRGLSYSVNTDDPAMFGNDMTTEFELVRGAFGLDVAAFRTVYANCIDAAFADDDVKASLASSLQRFELPAAPPLPAP